MLVTIHQPDFLPWLGLFNKINKADHFIILDHVLNNPKAADFYCRRVKMLIGGKEHWMSVTLKKDPDNLFIPINTMELQMDDTSTKKFLQSVDLNYRKAPFFSEVFSLVNDYFYLPTNNLSKKNCWFIIEVMKKLNINTTITYSSDLNPQFTSNEMLIDLLQKSIATTYLCGSGAMSYQNDDLYLKNNIKVEYNNFVHPIYNQFNSKQFLKGLSIIDALMNLGFEETSKLIK